MAKREFLMLAKTYNPEKDCVQGWFVSEKLDGVRCFWDGGITRNTYKEEVPWANLDKDDRYLNKEVATGLWSRHGNVIHAPEWWLNRLPNTTLDGELFIKRRGFQQLTRVIKPLIPDESLWGQVKYHIFDSPPYETIFADGEISTVHYKKVFRGIMDFISRNNDHIICPQIHTPYSVRYNILQEYVNDVVRVVEQIQLPYGEMHTVQALDTHLNGVLSLGGEGIMLRNPRRSWFAERSHNLLKMKPKHDAEGTVIGAYTAKEGKLRGMFGSLLVSLDDGSIFKLSGFTDSERTLSDTNWAWDNPDTLCPDNVVPVNFKYGERISFKYGELTENKIPRDARYWRKEEVI